MYIIPTNGGLVFESIETELQCVTAGYHMNVNSQQVNVTYLAQNATIQTDLSQFCTSQHKYIRLPWCFALGNKLS